MSDDIASAPASASPGDKIAGYRLEEQIGQGGMAVVYRAHDERLDRSVALKVLAPALAADTAFRARFIRESRAAAAVDHPNIIPVYDAGDASGALFISMRYVQGGDVRSLIAGGKPLGPARTWHIISQVASALDAAHATGLVHRDVKPANMLLDASGVTGQGQRAGEDEPQDHVYLSDFGISKRTVASNLTSTGQFVGTLDYIAPEQIEGLAVDGRTDQYSLACAAYELLSGVPPFRRSAGLALINAHLSAPAPSLTAQRPELPAAVDLVLGRAMAKSPGQRYATCAAFALDLGRALGLATGPLEASSPPVGPAAAGGGQPGWQPTALAQPAAGAGTAGTAGTAGAAAAAGAAIPADAPGAPSGPQGSGQAGYPTGPTGPSGPGQQGSYQATQYQQQAPPTPYQPAQYQPTQYQQPQYQQPQYQQPQYQQGTYQQGTYQQGTYQQGGGAFVPPQYQTAQQQGPRRRSRGLVVGLIVAVLVLAGGGAAAYELLGKPGTPPANGQSSSPPISPASSSPGTSSSPPATAMSQAAAVGNLLSGLEATRSQLGTPINDIEYNCTGLTSTQFADDVNAIKNIAAQRQSEYNQALALQTNLLPSGTQLHTYLLQSIKYSLNADNDYLAWAQQEQGGCFPNTESSAFNSAGTWDSQAVTAKSNFASLWDSFATQYGQQTVQQTQI